MPRDNDADYNKLEGELAQTKAALAAAKKNTDDPDDREEIEEKQARLKQKSREIKGMSESTAHSLLEEMRAMRADMADRFGVSTETKPAAPAKDGKTGETKPAEDSGFSLSKLFFD